MRRIIYCDCFFSIYIKVIFRSLTRTWLRVLWAWSLTTLMPWWTSILSLLISFIKGQNCQSAPLKTSAKFFVSKNVPTGPKWRLWWHNIFESIFLWKMNLKELNSHIFFNKLFIPSIILFKEISLRGSTDEILISFTPKLLHITLISIVLFAKSVACAFSCSSFVPACIIYSKRAMIMKSC